MGFGNSLDDVLRHCLHLPTHHGRIHDMDIWYFGVNARMHWVNVAMGIGTLVLFIGNISLHYEFWVMVMHM
jgi:hypothetical protein